MGVGRREWREKILVQFPDWRSSTRSCGGTQEDVREADFTLVIRDLACSELSAAKFDCQFCSTLDNMNQFVESEVIQAICLPASGPTDWSKTASTVMDTT